MKKLIIMIALMSGFVGLAMAQTVGANPNPLKNPNGFALDTATQAAVEGPITLAVKGSAKTFNIVLPTTKISGTVVGSISWQGSNTGLANSWFTISTTALVDQAGVTVYGYKEVDKGFVYYRALITQTGTSSISYSGTYYFTRGPIPGQ